MNLEREIDWKNLGKAGAEKKEYIKMNLEREVIWSRLAKAGSERKKNILKWI